MARTSPKDSKFLKKARERWKLADDTDTSQSLRERDDLAFYAGDQWPAAIVNARKAQNADGNMPAVPARPTLVINKVREPVRQVQNLIRASEIGIELVPADDFGDLGIVPDDTEVSLREGLIRRIQRDSDAQDARNWAGDRADIAGRGYYLVMTRYLPGKTSDQEIYIHRIYNQAGVKLDPSHVMPDGSDAEWGFIGTWLSWDRYKGEHGILADGKKNPFSGYTERDFMGMTETYPDWYKAEKDERDVRVVDYWYTERTTRTLATVQVGEQTVDVWEDELPDGVEPIDTRSVVEKTIQFCKIGGGVQVLEETDWAGPDMPIIKVLGEELQPYDEERRCEGIVRNSRDAQMGENYMISKLVESVGLTPIPVLQLDPEAIEGYEKWYDSLNTRALPWAPYRTYDDQGRPLKEPHRLNVDPNIAQMAGAIGMFDTFIKSTTAVPDPTLGNVDPSLKSGRAIRETVANAAQSTSNFLDNRVRSMRYEAKVVNNLLYPIYGMRPGRMLRILTGEGQQQRMQIANPQQQAKQQQAAKVAKLTKDANFNIAVKVTKNSENRRDQVVSMLGEIISAAPEQMAIQGDIFYRNMDIPERKEMAERMRVMLAPQVQAYLASKEQGGAVPPQVQAQMAKQQEQIQRAEQIINAQEQEIASKQAEAAAKVEIERIKAANAVLLQKMDDAKAIRVAEIGALSKGMQADAAAQVEAIALAHEAEQSELEREHALTTQVTGLAHEAAQSSVSHDQAMEADAMMAPPKAG